MAQIFKAKTLVANTGKFAYEVSAPNLVYNTGNQNISGVKNFYSRPTVNGTGVLLIGEASNIILPNTIVYTTGNQTISGTKTFVENTVFGDPSQGDFLVISGNTFSIYGSGNFTSGLFVNGNPVLTGVDLSSYATNVNLFTTGSTLDNKINSLSGLFTGYTGSLDATFASDAQLFATGSTLDNKINSLSGVSVLTFGDQLISGNKTFLNNVSVSGSGIFNALDLNNIDILSLSGVDISITNGNVSLTNRPAVNGTGVVLIGELNPIIVNTGSILDNKINSLSGYLNSQDVIFSGQTFNTGSRLDNKINSLSGYVNSQDIIFSGQIASTGSILDTKINSLSGLFTTYTGNLDATFATDAQLFNTGSTLDNKINSLSGYVNSQDNVLSSQIFNTGSRLDNKINSLSGYVNIQDVIFSGQMFNTGSRLDDKINSLSGYVDSKPIVLPTTIVYTTGDQLISGNKTFLNNISVSGTGSFNNLKVSNIDKLFLSGIDIVITGNSSINVYNAIYISGNPVLTGIISTSQTITNVVYTTGDQTISGNKTFDVFPIVSGNKLVTGIDLSSYATTANLFITGSTLDNKINSLSGYVNYQDTIFSGQTFNTGSRLDNKINSLSGYVDSKDVILSGQIASTGSSLYNSILSLSGLFTGYTGNLDANFASDAQLFATGSILDNKINSLSGYISGISAGGFLPNSIVYITGDQTISGVKSFSDQIKFLNPLFAYPFYPTISGGGSNDGVAELDIDAFKLNLRAGYGKSEYIELGGEEGRLNINTVADTSTFNLGAQHNASSSFSYGITSPSINLYGQVNGQTGTFEKFYANNLVYNTGNQTISGIKTFNFAPVVSGNSLITGVNLGSYATVSNLFSTGSNLDNKINSLSGLFTSYTGNLDTNFATDAQLFTTGSTLDNKINSLSGYVNSRDILFSGQIASTGSILDNKINNLSGYINTSDSNIVFTTGNQTIGGIKTFEVGNGDSKVIISGSDAFDYALSVVNNSNQGNVLFLKKGTNPGGGAVSENFVIKAVDRADDLIFTLKSTQAGTNRAGFFCDPDGVNDAGGPNVSADSVVISGRTYTIGEIDNQLQYILSDSNSIQAVNPVYSYTGGLFFDNNGLNLKFVDKNGNYSALNPIEVTSGNDVLINGNSSFGIYQQGTLYPQGTQTDIHVNQLTHRLNSLSFYSGIVSGTNFLSGLKPGHLLYYTAKSNANYANVSDTRSRVRLKARPYMVVDEATNFKSSYLVDNKLTSAGNTGNFSFLKFNNNSQYSGLAIKQLIFNPTIQNAYRNYDLARGVSITVKPRNIHLETFIDVNVKSGDYWSLGNLGITPYGYFVNVQKPKATNFTQAHVLNFKLNFERDDRVTRAVNYPNRLVTILGPNSQFIPITGYDFQFSQKLRLILNTDGSLKEW